MEVGILLLDYILTRLKEDGTLPKNAAVVKSFVTTGMVKPICADKATVFKLVIHAVGEGRAYFGNRARCDICFDVFGIIPNGRNLVNIEFFRGVNFKPVYNEKMQAAAKKLLGV